MLDRNLVNIHNRRISASGNLAVLFDGLKNPPTPFTELWFTCQAESDKQGFDRLRP